MIPFEKFRKTCALNSEVSKTIIDEFLLYYAAAQYNLDRSMNVEFSKYKHVTNNFEKEWINRLKAQYLAYKIFKAGGLIRKIITHVELQRLSKNEIDFLKVQASHPWRFCFSILIENPVHDFFVMEDILTGEEFTLFSPGTSEILKEQNTTIWFNLISFNGDCWQSFGPIGAYKSFEEDDIFFFATEIDYRIETEEDIIHNIEKDPLPYMMLLSGANFPLTVHKQDQMIIAYAEYPVDSFDTLAIKKSFTSEFSHDVYKLRLKKWGEYPHFASIYYDEKKKAILLSASTDRGFFALVNAINQFGYRFSTEPDVRINMSMLITSKKILKKEIKLNKYDHLFHIDSPPAEKEGLDKINVFLGLLIPDINAGRKPDIEKYAAKTGVDIETARDLANELLGKYGRR